MNGFFRFELGDYVEAIIEFIIDTFAFFFDGVSVAFSSVYDALAFVFAAPPFWVIIAIFAALAWWLKGPVLAVGTALGLLLIVSLDQWENAMDTLALVLVAASVAIVLSIPLGIWAARNDTVSKIVRPVLDFMQTTPAFVYLVPALLLFSVGPVPGIVATIVFAMAPGVRLTELGIRGVDKEVVEAGNAFGATPGRILRQIQLPLAMPSIMAGVNQVILLSLSMVVIAGLVGAGGLGSEIVSSLSSLNISLGVEAGLAVVILAMILDRMTAALASRPERRRAQRAAHAADQAKQAADAAAPVAEIAPGRAG